MFSTYIHIASASDPATWMPDANLRAAVRSALGLSSNEALTEADMEGLTILTARNAQISNLTGLEHATNLTKLDLRRNDISNISALTGLTSLTHLWLAFNSITDSSPVGNLTNLTILTLRDNPIGTITHLGSLTNLTTLWIINCGITDVSPLMGLVNLSALRIARNELTNAHLLDDLTNLTDVDITIPDPPTPDPPADVDPPGVSIAVPSGVQNGAFDATLTFTEAVSGFAQSEVSLSGSAARITSWSANSSNTVYTATITPTASGTVTIGVAANVATDGANNQNTAATSKSVTVDVDRPTVTIGVPSVTQTGAFNATITFSESVSGFVQSEVSLSGSAASITSWRANSGSTVYTATITPTASGTVTVGVAADVATDAANNPNTAATSKTVSVDVDRPSVTIGVPSSTQTEAFNATITFSETVSGFVQSEVSLAGSAASITSWRANGDNTVYTATVTPTANGTVTVGVAANVATDAANNSNTAATSKTVTVNIPDPIPDPATWMPDANLRAAVRSALGIASNENFSKDDLGSLTSLRAVQAQISNLTGLEYATNLTELVAWQNDISSLTPIQTLTQLTDLRIGNNEISNVSPLTGLTNLTKLGLQRNNITNVAPLATLVNLTWLRLASNSITDLSPLVTLVNVTDSDVNLPEPDTTAPGVSISVPSGVQNGAFNATITFTEAVSGFVQSDVSLTGSVASITAWRANSGNTIYTATITPTASGTVTVSVAANVATDAANNPNTAATSQTVTVDVDRPTVTIGVPSGTQTGAFDVTITFSETVSGFAQLDVSLAGSATSITSWRANSNNTVYTATITPTASGTATIGVAANVATDAANNSNTAATSQTVSVDVDRPTVTIGVPSGTQNGAFDVTITFTETVSGFVQSDASLTGSAASITSWSMNGDNTVYTATITPTASGTVTIGVAANVATDAASNPNTAATSRTVTVALPELIPNPATWMPDANLRAAVRSALGIASNENFSKDDLSTLTSLRAVQAQITNLTGLEYATNLTSLAAWQNQISSLTPLENLTTLTDVRLGNNDISDVTPLDGLTSLTHLGLQRNDITNVVPLATLVNLTWLRLAGNPINDLSPLVTLVNVTNSDVDLPEPDTTAPGVSISVPSGVQNGAFNATITFTEAVSGFVGSEVSLTGSAASITSWRANSDNTTYTATITPTASGTVTVGVAANVATDAANNQNTAATSKTVTVSVDTTAPGVSISVPSGVQNGAFSVSITFTEAVSGFTQSDVSVTGSAASITSWRANSDNTVYTATITPTASGTVTIGVAANVATDAANNQNTAATSKTVTVSVDTTAPGVSISVPSGTQTGAFSVTITFTEAVSGFVQSDVFLSGSMASITTWSANSDNTAYTATITPTASGTVTIDVAANVAVDAASNPNTVATTQTVTVDLDPPSVTLTLLSEVEDNRIDVQITFNEPVEGFDRTDLSVTTNGLTQLDPRVIEEGTHETPGGPIATPQQTIDPPPIVSITGWTPSQDKTIYTVYITTYTKTEGQVIINVPTGVATDIAGNPNVAGSELSVDEAPGFYIFVSTFGPNGWSDGNDSSRCHFNLGRLRDYLDVDQDGSIDEDDVTLVQAALGQFGDGIVNSRTDINCDNTVDNDDLALLDDTEAPTFSILVPTDTQSASAFEIRITSSELVFDFDATDVSLTGSTATATVTKTAYSRSNHYFKITPTTSGDLVISVPAGAAKDAFDNQNTASGTYTVTVDMGIPHVSSITATIVESGVFKITVTFSEAVSGFDQADLSVSGAGASITAWETTDNTTFTATVTATTDGFVNYYVPAGVATDADGKSNTASNWHSREVDMTAPSVEVSVPVDAQSGAFDVTITFSEKVYNFEQADVSLANSTAAATITDWTVKYPYSSSYRTTYEATITPTTSGTVVITIPADVATDVRGNGNTASDTHSITVSHPAAPAALNGIILDPIVLKTLDPEVLETQLDILRAGSDGSLRYLQAIALLESVLAEMRPEKTVLLANYPNPFNPETWIPYHLANDTDVQISIYDINGALVRQLDLGYQQTGYYTNRSRAAYWDGRNEFGEQVATGIYFYQLQADNMSLLRKMIILK